MRALLVLAIAACTAATAAPGPAVTVANGRPGEFTIEAKAAIRLRSIGAIQGLRDGRWADVSVDLDTGYKLVQCDTKPDCLDLAAGAKLSPRPWTGMSCSSQCTHACDKNAPRPAGEYRLVVTSCDGNATFAGPSFHFDGKPR
jgi:hypothetical protein